MAKRKTKRNALLPPGLLEGIEFQTGGSITGPLLKKVGEVYARNPGTGSFARCVAAVKAHGGVSDPNAVCAASKRRTAAGARELAAASRKARRHNLSRKAARFTYKVIRTEHKDPLGKPIYGVHEFKGGRMVRGGWFGTRSQMQKLAARMRQEERRISRRNPEDAAAERYKYFHGRDPDVITEVKKTMHIHSVLSGVGKLEKIKIDGVTLGGFKGALLAQNEKGTQLFIEGGDQKIDLKAFGITSAHEMEVLGECSEIWYHTTKTHLEPKDGGTAVYHHKFGREKPVIVYDVPNQQLYFAGGGYSLPDVGIDG